MRRYVSLLVSLLLLLTLLSGCADKLAENRPLSKTGFMLDTIITIAFFEGGDEALLEECFHLISEYEERLSRTLPESEISRLSKEGSLQVSSETAEVISVGLEFGRVTEGAFDITIGAVSSLWDFHAKGARPPDAAEISERLPLVDYRAVTVSGNVVTLEKPGMALDLGGIAKGYICGEIAELLKQADVKSAICDFGGDVTVFGGKPDGSPFRVGIRSPFDKNRLFCVLELSDAAIVTSGTYERSFEFEGQSYHHILDPNTGFSTKNDVVSVTVVGTSAAVAEAYSTACVVRGDLSLLIRDGLEGFLIWTDGSVEKTEGIGTEIPMTVKDKMG